MVFKFDLSEEQLNVILKHLDLGPHKEVRPVLDYLFSSAQAQAQAAQAQAAKAQAAPDVDASPSSTNS